MIALVTAAALGTPAVRSAWAASCKEGSTKTEYSTIPNPNGPGVANQQKDYQCVQGRWVLVCTVITSSMANPDGLQPTSSGGRPTYSTGVPVGRRMGSTR